MQPAHRPLPAFGRRLKRLRRSLGMKQTALAELMKVDQTTVSRWESAAILPDRETQQAAFEKLSACRKDDGALKRLVESSSDPVHLVEETSHICLAYSRSRAIEWRSGTGDLLGQSLWKFATEEIQQAEHELIDAGWWDIHVPEPKLFRTSGASYAEMTILPGAILWERLYLADGTPVRLASGARRAA